MQCSCCCASPWRPLTFLLGIDMHVQSESRECGMPGGGHSAALPVPCPLCVDVPPVTECGTSLLPCAEVHCAVRKERAGTW